MRFSLIISLLSSLAAAIPAPEAVPVTPSGHEVEIVLPISYAGSGCPAGSVSPPSLSDDLTTVTIMYDSFIAQSGPNIQPKDYRKNCQLNVKLRYPAGWQFSVFKADYRGFAAVSSGSSGTCKATYYFSGDSRQVCSSVLCFVECFGGNL
jgi:hypothetical protein